MEHIKEVVSTVLERLTQKNQHDVSMTAAWQQATTPEMQKHAKPYRLARRTLFVAVDDAPWAYELSQRYKQGIIARMNNVFGEEKIGDVYFRVKTIA